MDEKRKKDMTDKADEITQSTGSAASGKSIRRERSASRRALAQLVGLEEAKRMVDGIVDFYRVQGLRKDNYPQVRLPAMHLIFSGNPGTAKRTVAGLFGKILKEEGIIGRGELYEVGQAELLGSTAGASARNIRDYFEKASGAVLYIKNAPSLMGLPEHHGRDAIPALLREMDGQRKGIAVILSGDRRKLDEMEQSYPEISGRIAFRVRFPDYSMDELYEILCKLALKEGFVFSRDVRESFLQRILWKDTKRGNAKLVRNLLDQAKLNQAGRLLRLPEKRREQEMMVIRGEDFI